MDIEINDVRKDTEFKMSSFSGYKRVDVIKEYLKSLQSSKIEESCYWSAELVCGGHYMDLWQAIIVFMSKNIHFGNPKLPSYIDMRINTFKDVVHNGFIGNELRMRNSQKIRKLFAEVSVILCLSMKKHTVELVKLDKNERFDLTKMNHHFKAYKSSYANLIFRKDDPKELFVAINEMMYHLSPSSLSSNDVCWWVEWILAYEQECSKKKIKCICDRREYGNVPTSNQKDIIWIIWEAILITAEKKNTFIKKLVNSLFTIFTLRFTPGVVRRRRHVIYFAIMCLIEHVNQNVQLVKDKAILENITNKINNIYKQIKKSEKSPETDYLFKDVKKSNLEKTIEKLDIMNKFF